MTIVDYHLIYAYKNLVQRKPHPDHFSEYKYYFHAYKKNKIGL